jgi:methyl-accepting chemotaxis protein
VTRGSSIATALANAADIARHIERIAHASEENREVAETTNRLSARLADIAGRLDAIDASVTSLAATLLKGNGQPAIVERLTRVEDALTVAADTAKEAAILAKENADHVNSVAVSVEKVSGSVDSLRNEMKDYPTINRVIAKNPLKALTYIVGAIVTGVSIWIGLYALVQLPGVERWFSELLHLP